MFELTQVFSESCGHQSLCSIHVIKSTHPNFEQTKYEPDISIHARKKWGVKIQGDCRTPCKTNLKSDKTEKYCGKDEIVKEQNLLHIQCCRRPCAVRAAKDRQRERAHHPYLDCEIGEVVWWDYSPLRVGRMPRNEFVFVAMLCTPPLHSLIRSIDFNYQTSLQNDHFIFITKLKLTSYPHIQGEGLQLGEAPPQLGGRGRMSEWRKQIAHSVSEVGRETEGGGILSPSRALSLSLLS